MSKVPPLTPDSPDEIAFGRLHAPILVVGSSSYAGSSGRILTDPTGESKESAVWSAFPRLSVLPVQSIRGIRAECGRVKLHPLAQADAAGSVDARRYLPSYSYGCSLRSDADGAEGSAEIED